MDDYRAKRRRDGFTKSDRKFLMSFAIAEIKRNPYNFLVWVQKIVESKDEKIEELKYELGSQNTVNDIYYMRLKETREWLEEARAEIKALKS